MPVNHELGASSRLLGLVALGLLLGSGGCAFFRQPAAAPRPEGVVRAAATELPQREEPETVTSNLPELPAAAEPAAGDAGAAAAGAATTVVIPDAGPQLAASAPKSYVVKRGDTLWGLAGMFLKDPWQWPEIWYLNPEVSNPHRIYPGDTLRLVVGADGRQQLQLARGADGGASAPVAAGEPATPLHPLLRSEPYDAPIETIPYSAIAGFISRPALLTREQVKAAPYILALRDSHMIAGTGNDLYVSKLAAGRGERFNIMHITEPLKVPGQGTVGYIAQFAGVAEVTQAGDPARAQLTESARETLTGDVLIPEAGNVVADIHPHRPPPGISTRILAVINGVLLAGQYQVVAISGGSAEGVEPGHVLQVLEERKSVRDRCARLAGSGSCLHFSDTLLPQESSGTLLVFRSYPHMSYALVASETTPLRIGDHAVTP